MHVYAREASKEESAMKRFRVTFTDGSSRMVQARTGMGAMLKAKNYSQLPIVSCIEI
jgi:hypothetical protein